MKRTLSTLTALMAFSLCTQAHAAQSAAAQAGTKLVISLISTVAGEGLSQALGDEFPTVMGLTDDALAEIREIVVDELDNQAFAEQFAECESEVQNIANYQRVQAGGAYDHQTPLNYSDTLSTCVAVISTEAVIGEDNLRQVAPQLQLFMGAQLAMRYEYLEVIRLNGNSPDWESFSNYAGYHRDTLSDIRDLVEDWIETNVAFNRPRHDAQLCLGKGTDWETCPGVRAYDRGRGYLFIKTDGSSVHEDELIEGDFESFYQARMSLDSAFQETYDELRDGMLGDIDNMIAELDAIAGGTFEHCGNDICSERDITEGSCYAAEDTEGDCAAPSSMVMGYINKLSTAFMELAQLQAAYNATPYWSWTARITAAVKVAAKKADVSELTLVVSALKAAL